MIATHIQQLRGSVRLRAHKAATVPLGSSIENDQRSGETIDIVSSKSGATLEIADSKKWILSQN